MALFTRRSTTDTSELHALRGQLAQLNERVTNAEQDRHRLETRLAETTATLASVHHRMGEVDQHIDSATERWNTIDQRITNTTTELANQLGEFGSEIDALHTRSTPSLPPPTIATAQHFDTSVVDELKTSQARLAEEQIRYQIAFRQQLASVHDSLKRQRP